MHIKRTKHIKSIVTIYYKNFKLHKITKHIKSKEVWLQWNELLLILKKLLIVEANKTHIKMTSTKIVM